MAASNRDLSAEVKAGRFRADLYHRLCAYPLHIPPLRERGDDVVLLAGYFLEQNRSRLGLRNLRLGRGCEAALARAFFDKSFQIDELLEFVQKQASGNAKGSLL